MLTHVLLEDMDEEDGDSEPGRRWIEFVGAFHPVDPPEPDGRDLDLIERWVDEAVDAFCRRNRVLDNWRFSVRSVAVDGTHDGNCAFVKVAADWTGPDVELDVTGAVSL